MDRAFFWLPGWRSRERSEIREMIAQAVAEERWIMDGTSPSTMDFVAAAPTMASTISNEEIGADNSS